MHHFSGDGHLHREFIGLEVLRILCGIHTHKGEMTAREEKIHLPRRLLYFKSQREIRHFLHHIHEPFRIDCDFTVKALIGDFHAGTHHRIHVATGNQQSVSRHFQKEVIQNGKCVFCIHNLADSGELLLKGLSVNVEFHIYFYFVIFQSFAGAGHSNGHNSDS